MAESKTAPIVVGICTVIVSVMLLWIGSLLMQIEAQMGEANVIADEHGDVLEVIADETTARGWEYDVVSIPDGAWGSKAKKMGEHGWEIVSARRATGADDSFMYECIVRKRLAPPVAE